MTLPIKRISARQVLLGVAVSLACSSSFGASFDCSKARSKSERLICGDQQLSAMDDQLGDLARAGKRRSDKPRQYQRALDDAWLVRQKCQDVACVELWYRQRLALLSHGGASVAPAADTAAPKAASAPPALAKAPPPVRERSAAIVAPAAVAPQPKPVPAVVAKTAPVPTRPAPVAVPAPATLPAPIVQPAPAVTAPPLHDTKPPLASAPVVARQRLSQRPARVALAPRPTVAKSAKELQNVTPGAPLQVIGGELGFDIPLTKDAFLERYAASGGDCGASRNWPA